VSQQDQQKGATIINLIGGPNTGKTCTALGLSYFMKRAGLRVKYVQEYAEDMVYEDRANILADQLYILAKQNRRLHRLRSVTDYVITDSPLLLNIVYSKDEGTPEFRATVHEYWDSYNNITFYHPRDTSFAYHQQGRVQDSHEAASAMDTIIQRNLRGATVNLEIGTDYIKQIVDYFNFHVDLAGPGNRFNLASLARLRQAATY
jgi:hypothetical protein